VVSAHVLHGRCRVLHFVFLLYYLHRRSQLLAHQPVCGRHHEYVLGDPINDEKECFRCCSVCFHLFLPSLMEKLKLLLISLKKSLTTTEEHDESWDTASGRKRSRNQYWKDLMHALRWIWVLLALASLVLQATGNANPSPTHQEVLNWGEIAITVAFDIEIVLRFLVELPEWRNFFLYGHNWLDLVLAVGSSVIQIPVIKDSVVYSWLTIFQLARFYRVILEVPHMKPLLVRVSFFSSICLDISLTLFCLARRVW
jgi:hypothetical protein